MVNRFRSANEQIAAQARALGYDGWVPFVCECADERCVQLIRMPVDAFDDVVSSGGALTFPGHRPRRPDGVHGERAGNTDERA